MQPVTYTPYVHPPSYRHPLLTQRRFRYHGNVCDNSKFNVAFVQKFNVILSALDNVTARRRVNRLALAASVPLIEAGTTGYLGQVNVLHKPSQTACYECQTKETGKVYPICTIRSTPTAPVHCIVWSKELYKLLFGEKLEESMLFEDDTTEEPSTYMKAVKEFREGKGSATDLIHCLYNTEIEKQLGMDRYKTAKVTPSAMSKDLLSDIPPPPSSKEDFKTTTVWSAAECVAETIACLESTEPRLPSFDKDDDIGMRFVAATSNLRMLIFGIEPLQSLYDAKGIAGNIIPAIATTNAVVAGLQILQTFRILQAQLDEKPDQLRDYCSYVNCVRNSTRNGLYLTSCTLDDPNPDCFVCSKANLPLHLKLDEWTLEQFLDKVVKKDLGFESPSLLLESNTIWEEGDDADTEAFAVNLKKRLADLPCGGIQHGSVVVVEDFSQDLEVQVTVMNVEKWETEEDEAEELKFVVGGNKPIAKVEKPSPENQTSAGAKVATPKSAQGDDDDIVEIMDVDDGDNGKLKRSSEGTDEERPSKKAKSTEEAADEVVMIDDD